MIADRGYAKAGEMATFRAGPGGRTRDFIVRTGWNMLRLEKPDGKPFDLPGALRQMQQDPAPEPLNEAREWVLDALYGRGKTIKRLPIRLLILAVPPDKAEIARKKLRRSASKRQHQLDPNSELAAGFVMLATSLSPDIPAGEICAVYRLRWQIELAFKRLKSLLNIDRLPTWTEAGSLSWLYSHLIFALLTDDICQEILEAPPSGPRR
jgi:Transposase DDE domain